MKNSILIIGTVVLSILNMNATNENINFNPLSEITKSNIAQVFEWEAETHKGTYTGTALSLETAQRMITLSSSGETLINKKITSYFIQQNSDNNTMTRNYFWEVNTANGHAKGYASSEDYARKMIALVTSGDTIIDKIIISQPQH